MKLDYVRYVVLFNWVLGRMDLVGMYYLGIGCVIVSFMLFVTLREAGNAYQGRD